MHKATMEIFVSIGARHHNAVAHRSHVLGRCSAACTTAPLEVRIPRIGVDLLEGLFFGRRLWLACSDATSPFPAF